jgi:hypothetical protein
MIIGVGAGRVGMRMVVKIRLELGGRGFSKGGMAGAGGSCAKVGAATVIEAAIARLRAKRDMA